MEKAAPKLAHDGWAHKYGSYQPRPHRMTTIAPGLPAIPPFQAFTMPPDKVGILDGSSPRFICAGRFIAAARELEVPVTTLNTILNRRDGAFHRYWKVGTTEGSDGGSHWTKMREGGFVSIGAPSKFPIGQMKSARTRPLQKIEFGIFCFRLTLLTQASRLEKLVKY